MQFVASLALLALFGFFSACGNHDHSRDRERSPQKDAKEKQQPEDNTDGRKTARDRVQMKDQTSYPAIQHAIPVAPIDKSYSITRTTKISDLPVKRPDSNTVYFSAEKMIDGKKRIISVVFGDILKEEGAIVNAANSSLLGGGGIDGIIHDAALVDGKDLLREEAIAYKKFHNLDSFPEGTAMVLNPYGLPDKISMVVATVGPTGGNPNRDSLLYSAIYNSLVKANEYGAKSVSIPAVSTGIFGFPADLAAPIYLEAALRFFATHKPLNVEAVRFIDVRPEVIKHLGNAFVANIK